VVSGASEIADLLVKLHERLVRRPVLGVLVQGRPEPVERVLRLAQSDKDAAQLMTEGRVVGPFLADQVLQLLSPLEVRLEPIRPALALARLIVLAEQVQTLGKARQQRQVGRGQRQGPAQIALGFRRPPQLQGQVAALAQRLPVARVIGQQLVEQLLRRLRLAIAGQAAGQAEEDRRVLRLLPAQVLEMLLGVGEAPQRHLDLGQR
jgi:hypothetical protein